MFGIGDGSRSSIYLAARSIERADQLPSAEEDTRFLEIENCGVGVEVGSECVGGFNLRVNVWFWIWRGH